MPASQPTYVRGSTLATCSQCGASVHLSPASVVPAFTIPILCLTCAIVRATERDEQIHAVTTDAQRAELSAHGVTEADLEKGLNTLRLLAGAAHLLKGKP